MAKIISSEEWNENKKQLSESLQRRSEAIIQQIALMSLMKVQDGKMDDKIMEEVVNNYTTLFGDFFNSGALVAVALIKMQIVKMSVSIPSELETDPEKLKKANEQQKMFQLVQHKIVNLLAEMVDSNAFDYTSYIKTDK